MDFIEFELEVRRDEYGVLAEMVNLAVDEQFTPDPDGPASDELRQLAPTYGEAAIYYGDELIYLRGMAWAIMNNGGQRELQRVSLTSGQTELSMPEISPDAPLSEFGLALDKTNLDEAAKLRIRSAYAAHTILKLTSRIQLKAVK
jgi:hypothetical protein